MKMELKDQDVEVHKEKEGCRHERSARNAARSEVKNLLSDFVSKPHISSEMKDGEVMMWRSLLMMKSKWSKSDFELKS